MNETAVVKYIFLDIVGFTKDRSVEAQAEIVGALNDIVRTAVQPEAIPDADLIYLPTGDGMAIAIIASRMFDIHIRIALRILALVESRNHATTDEMRQFQVRIGINENVDNLVTDINGRANVAGFGISLAQRIMDKADGGQILVGQAVWETIRSRERYMRLFREFGATAKHGFRFSVHQMIEPDAAGLNIAVPAAFAETSRAPLRLTKLVAYYIAHAHANREFLSSQRDDYARDEAGTILLYALARDSVEATERLEHESASSFTWNGSGKATFKDRYAHYGELDFWPRMWLAKFIRNEHLTAYSDCFHDYLFPKPEALRKLSSEFPQIAKEFGLDAG